ncbi:MAG: hypothetical protein QXW94_05770 [Desulfurococcaceae archaeon]
MKVLFLSTRDGVPSIDLLTSPPLYGEQGLRAGTTSSIHPAPLTAGQRGRYYSFNCKMHPSRAHGASVSS